MGFSVELFFDKNSNHVIRNYWTMMGNKGIRISKLESGSDPHLTLAIYSDGLDQEKFASQFKAFRPDQFKISFSSIGFFCTKENTVFISPKVSFELLDLHEKFHKTFREFILSESRYYLPEMWIPHCTVNMDMDDADFHKTLEIMKNEFKPFTALAVRIGFIKYKPVQLLFETKLNEGQF